MLAYKFHFLLNSQRKNLRKSRFSGLNRPKMAPGINYAILDNNVLFKSFME